MFFPRRWILFASAASALAFVSCATAVLLNESGRSVSVVGTRYTPNLEAYEPVGSVGASCNGGLSRKANLESCQNEIRNDAAKKGGSLVVVEEQILGRWWCDACVKIKGTVYRRRR